MFVRLFVVYRPSQELFTEYGDVTITELGLQILTYARHSWLLNNEFFSLPHLL